LGRGSRGGRGHLASPRPAAAAISDDPGSSDLDLEVLDICTLDQLEDLEDIFVRQFFHGRPRVLGAAGSAAAG
jgi:hypothetical protein